MDYNVRFNLAKTAALVVGAAVISFATSAVVASRAYVTRGVQAVRLVSQAESQAQHRGQFGLR